MTHANSNPDLEHVDVVIVGAGLSGIAAAHYIRTQCPWATYAVIEARSTIGGTWDLFRYPGVRSDSDMFTLGFSFRPWNRPEAIAEGDTILNYLQETVRDEGIDRHIRYNQRVVSANWSTPDARWHLKIETADETKELTAGFYINCSGYYRYDHGYEPDFPGRDRYEGLFIHPQQWPEDLDLSGKDVIIVGSGATAVTLAPALASTARSVTMLQRSPTYVASVPQHNPMSRLLRRVLPQRVAATATRWALALGTQSIYQLSQRFPQRMRRVLIRGAARQLPEGYDVERHFSPHYNPWDQRLCAVPDGDLFKAISAGDVQVVTDTIATFTESGITLDSGQHLEADAIVSATGLELLFLGGTTISVDGKPIIPAEHMVYKGMMLEDVPNLAVVMGYTNASWTLKAELTCDYTARIINHLRATGLRQAVPRNNEPGIGVQSLLGLDAGYIQRAEDIMPKQGTVSPWLVHQNYLKDYRTMKRSRIDDGVMSFENPAPALTTSNYS